MYLEGWNPREWKSDDDLEKPEEVERREKKALWRGKRRVAIQHVCKNGNREMMCNPLSTDQTLEGVRCDWMLGAQDGV